MDNLGIYIYKIIFDFEAVSFLHHLHRLFQEVGKKYFLTIRMFFLINSAFLCYLTFF